MTAAAVSAFVVTCASLCYGFALQGKKLALVTVSFFCIAFGLRAGLTATDDDDNDEWMMID